MTSTNKTLHELETVQMSESVTSIAASLDCVAVACLDDSIQVWRVHQHLSKKEPVFRRHGEQIGISDMCFNSNQSLLAVSCMDATVKLWQVDSLQASNQWDMLEREEGIVIVEWGLNLKCEPSTLECQPMQNWKITFVGNKIITAGQLGKISFFDCQSKERTGRLQLGDFLTSLTKSANDHFLAAGNDKGQVYIVNLTGGTLKHTCLEPHFRMVRSLAFTRDEKRLLTGCDDATIKVIDPFEQKVLGVLEGHSEAVSALCCPSDSPNIVLSASFDKTIKIWDLRQRGTIASTTTGSALWSLATIGKFVYAGGDNGILGIYAFE